MRYQVRVAGKLFEGTDHRSLLRIAVAARKAAPPRDERSRSELPTTLPGSPPTVAA
jgi:hypothetical protein